MPHIGALLKYYCRADLSEILQRVKSFGELSSVEYDNLLDQLWNATIAGLFHRERERGGGWGVGGRQREGGGGARNSSTHICISVTCLPMKRCLNEISLNLLIS
jgi:hypothetical protein